MEKKKVGRPIGSFKENKKNTGIHIRLTEEELGKIEKLSKIWNISRAKTIIKAIEESLESQSK